MTARDHPRLMIVLGNNVKALCMSRSGPITLKDDSWGAHRLS